MAGIAEVFHADDGSLRSFFGRYYPAVTFLEVSGLFDDDALVEIEAVALVSEIPGSEKGDSRDDPNLKSHI